MRKILQRGFFAICFVAASRRSIDLSFGGIDLLRERERERERDRVVVSVVVV